MQKHNNGTDSFIFFDGWAKIAKICHGNRIKIETFQLGENRLRNSLLRKSCESFYPFVQT